MILQRSNKKEFKTYKDKPKDGATHSQSPNGTQINTNQSILNWFMYNS